MLGSFIDKPREDSLTAGVFTYLHHLPGELFWRILRNACYTSHLTDYPGEPSVEFWPKWGSESTSNPNYVEPDMFLRFSAFDIIIEAKRNEKCMQSKDQWQRELVAYTNEYGEERKQVKILAIGGLHSTQDDMVSHKWHSSSTESTNEHVTHHFECPVHMCRWDGLLTECQRMEKELRLMRYPSSQTIAHRQILLDLIDLFACHGYQALTWFSERLPLLPQVGPSITCHQQAFRAISSHLSKR